MQNANTCVVEKKKQQKHKLKMRKKLNVNKICLGNIIQ